MTSFSNDLFIPSREQTLQDIEGCEDMQSLLEVVNPALSSWRRHWGDDLRASAALAYAWGSCSFPVAAAERVGFKGGSVLGERFVAIALGAAKAIARALLAPLPLDSTVLSAPLGKTPFELKIRTIRQAHALREKNVDELLQEASSERWGACHRAALTALASALRSRDELEASLEGEGAHSRNDYWVASGGDWLLDTLPAGDSWIEGAIYRSMGSWDQFPDFLSSKRSAPGVGELALEGQKLCAQFGLHWVGCAPMGASADACLNIASMRDLMNRASEALEVPQELMGAGGLALRVNGPIYQLGLMSTNPWSISVNRRCSLSTLVHEWVHALDALCQKSASSPEAERALKALENAHRAIERCPPDLVVQRLVLAGQPWRELAGAQLASVVNDPARSPQELLSAVEERVAGKSPRNLKIIDAAWRELSAPPEALHDFRELAQEVAIRAREAVRLRELFAKGFSVFVAMARLAEENCNSGSGHAKANVYWGTRAEKLARAGQGIVSPSDVTLDEPKQAPVYDSLLAAALQPYLIPHGAERETLARAIKDWVRESLPLLRLSAAPIPAQGPRKSQPR